MRNLLSHPTQKRDHYNVATGRRYRGVNLFVLGMSPLAFASGDRPHANIFIKKVLGSGPIKVLAERGIG
jgi:hypothetical protein